MLFGRNPLPVSETIQSMFLQQTAKWPYKEQLEHFLPWAGQHVTCGRQVANTLLIFFHQSECKGRVFFFLTANCHIIFHLDCLSSECLTITTGALWTKPSSCLRNISVDISAAHCKMAIQGAARTLSTLGWTARILWPAFPQLKHVFPDLKRRECMIPVNISMVCNDCKID